MQSDFFYVAVSSLGFDDYGIWRATKGTQAEAEKVANRYLASGLTRWVEIIRVRNDALDIKTRGCLQEVAARYQGLAA